MVSMAARAVRSLQGLRFLRGWQRLANAIAGSTGEFVIEDGPFKFAGGLDSFIDRQVYLFGGYETEQIECFVRLAPREGTVLDVGSNVGTHSLPFSRHFRKVLAFDPNPRVWSAFERNVALNDARNIVLHKVAASDSPGEQQLYNVEGGNLGLATLLEEEQYDRPLFPQSVASAVVLDDMLGDEPVVAAKIDTQGFEPQVLRGMQRTLARCRPVVWTEFGAATLAQVGSLDDLQSLFPYPVSVSRFQSAARLAVRRVELTPVLEGPLEAADYIIVPA